MTSLLKPSRVLWLVAIASVVALFLAMSASPVGAAKAKKCNIGPAPTQSHGIRVKLLDCPATVDPNKRTKFRIKLTSSRKVRNLKVSMVAHSTKNPATKYKARVFKKGRSKTLTYWLEGIPDGNVQAQGATVEITVKSSDGVSLLLLCFAEIPPQQ